MLWISVLTKGIIKLNPETEELVIYSLSSSKNQLSSLNNFSLHFDYQHILWIGSVEKGVDAIYNYTANSRLLQVADMVKKELFRLKFIFIIGYL